jgi:hypothetical protein
VPCPANLCFSIEWKLDEERVKEGLERTFFSDEAEDSLEVARRLHEEGLSVTTCSY